MATSQNDLTKSHLLMGTSNRILFQNSKALRWFKKRDKMCLIEYPVKDKKVEHVLTGTSEMRMYKRLWKTREILICDCCGVPLNKKPYDKDLDNLCLDCFKRLEMEFSDRDKYGFKKRPSIQSSVIRNDGEKRGR